MSAIKYAVVFLAKLVLAGLIGWAAVSVLLGLATAKE